MRKAFDLNSAMKNALAIILADNAAKLAKGDAGFRDQYTYFTATDLENQVRQLVQEQLDGKPLGSTGRAWGSGYSHVRISTGGRGSLLDVCRDYLRGEVGRTLEAHNFDRGHISGARFSPLGSGVAKKALEKVAEARAKRKPYDERVTHAPSQDTGSRFALCSAVKRREGRAGNYYSGRGSFVKIAREDRPVTCPVCLKLLKGRECFDYAPVFDDEREKILHYVVRRYVSVKALLDGKPDSAPAAKFSDWKPAQAKLVELKKAAQKAAR